MSDTPLERAEDFNLVTIGSVRAEHAHAQKSLAVAYERALRQMRSSPTQERTRGEMMRHLNLAFNAYRLLLVGAVAAKDAGLVTHWWREAHGVLEKMQPHFTDGKEYYRILTELSLTAAAGNPEYLDIASAYVRQAASPALSIRVEAALALSGVGITDSLAHAQQISHVLDRARRLSEEGDQAEKASAGVIGGQIETALQDRLRGALSSINPPADAVVAFLSSLDGTDVGRILSGLSDDAATLALFQQFLQRPENAELAAPIVGSGVEGVPGASTTVTR